MRARSAVAMAVSAIVSFSGSAIATDREYENRWLLPGDPLVEHQWNLLNAGQSAFAANGGKIGYDLNLWQTHLFGLQGQGVIVAVVDDGLEIAHPDLAQNIKPGSWDLVNNDDDPTPISPYDAHGTSVAGIIAAAGGNQIGVRGVAPRAGLKGFNFLAEQSLGSWLIAHGADTRSSDVRIFNQSYGGNAIFSYPYDLENDLALAMQDAVYAQNSTLSHSGRGALYVKSAGNGFNTTAIMIGNGIYKIMPKDYGWVESPNQGLPWQNSNLESSNANYWNMVISAMNADGELSSYSSVGSNVFLTAPAGEFGKDKPAHITTDLTGCERGYNRLDTAQSNGLHGGTADDPNCNYNGIMNGTSSSAPNTSGSAALLMTSRPDLTQRDIRHLLAKTATKIDPEQGDTVISYVTASGATRTVAAFDGWAKNAGGYDFSPYYGFGLIDVDKAMFESRTYQPLPPQKISDWSENTQQVAIPDAGDGSVGTDISIDNDWVVEAVQVKVDINHERTGDLLIELISPSGTSSVLMSPYNSMIGRSLYQGLGIPLGDEGRGYRDHLLLSHKFYGEPAAGQWKLRVTDVSKEFDYWVLQNRDNDAEIYYFPNPNNVEQGVLNHWSIRVVGHQG
ncbi:S8 family serine peptidase [Enterovibrio sp. ZSDZ35]|uniref:S8 family serine peptidase n=1 Tax=Enterovibrio qingdaonensis TaxID=2899818 RepID=A0ABT5QJF7_9GAMM|nr:S8 family serine peptidase [Enterovibrio sp. ZSDZ35]MDD1781127.1 S8 family serine peptidase [Enterovibrio sp. ZSDZ35]